MGGDGPLNPPILGDFELGGDFGRSIASIPRYRRGPNGQTNWLAIAYLEQAP
jgi:hypothetical protein